ncbi:MAG: hypothetical protein QM773_03115 [Hyphomonadaceae bacterium]
MKLKIALASASLLVLSACGTSQDALQALQSMQIMEDAKPGASAQLDAQSSSFISYEKLSGSGNDVTLHGVSFKAPAGIMEAMAGAESEVEALEDHHDHDGAAKPVPAPVAKAEAAGPMTVAKAETMVLKGLTMKDGKPLARDIVVSGVTPAFPMEGASLRVGTLGFEGMNEKTGAFIAGAFTKDGPGAPPAFADWAFSKASIGAVTFSMPIDQDEGEDGKVNAQLGELSFNGLSNETLGLARFSGLKGDLDIPGMPAIKGTFDLGTFDIEKFRLGMYARMFEAGMKSGQTGETPDFSKLLADYTSPLETTFDAARWSGAKVDVSGVKFLASPYSTTMTRNADGVVTAVNTPRWTMTLSADSSGGTLGAMGLMMLAMTGYPSNSIELYSEGAATFDPVKDITHWNNYNLGVSDLVDIKVSGGLVGLKQAMPSLVQGFVGVLEAAEATANSADDEDDADDADDGDDEDSDDDAPQPPKAVKPPSAAAAMDNPDMMQSAMQLGFALMSLQVTDLDVELTDKKLIELILTQAANSSGKGAETMRTDIVAQLQGAGELMSGAGIDPAIANELTTALAGFMSGPGTLHVQLKPKNPIGAMTFMMSPTKESLGFSATFTPAAK